MLAGLSEGVIVDGIDIVEQRVVEVVHDSGIDD